MKLKIIDTKNSEKGEIQLPKQFEEESRPDIVKRAVHSIFSKIRQKYGAKPDAGMRASADLSRRRRKYKGSYGHGISRVPRKIMSRRGTRFNWVGAVAPGTVGGRRAHPPKADKIWEQKINRKENRKAIRVAISATINNETVKERGHSPPEKYPFILDDSFENIKKTKELINILKAIGLEKELERASIKRVRAGKGKLRGRRYKKAIGPLIVVSKECELKNAVSNIPGLESIDVKKLNAKILAPGAIPGRLTLFTKSSIEKMEKEKLFNN
ncbi:MAG: 50S ribosomal protein L4 [Candidatus Woesearchaeota archaeon]